MSETVTLRPVAVADSTQEQLLPTCDDFAALVVVGNNRSAEWSVIIWRYGSSSCAYRPLSSTDQCGSLSNVTIMATQRKAVSGTVTACVSLSVRAGAKTFVPEDETVNNTNRGTPFFLTL